MADGGHDALLAVITGMVVGRVVEVEAESLDHRPERPAPSWPRCLRFLPPDIPPGHGSHFQVGKLHIMLGNDVAHFLKPFITAFRKSSCDKRISCSISVIFFIIYFPSTTELVSPSIPAAIINTHKCLLNCLI